jgi:hypothetical protein
MRLGYLRGRNEDLKHQNKALKGDRDNYKDEAERLRDQLKKR